MRAEEIKAQSRRYAEDAKTERAQYAGSVKPRRTKPATEAQATPEDLEEMLRQAQELARRR
jgi:hypothetical protein